MTVNPEERRYRVTAELRSVYQIVVQATSPEEAESFADDIDLEKCLTLRASTRWLMLLRIIFLKG